MGHSGCLFSFFLFGYSVNAARFQVINPCYTVGRVSSPRKAWYFFIILCLPRGPNGSPFAVFFASFPGKEILDHQGLYSVI